MAWSHCFCVAEWYPIACVCVCVCVHTPHLCPFTCWWALGLCPHLGYCKQCCCEHWSVCIFLNFGFLQMYAEEWDFTSIKWQKVEQVLFIPQIYICQKCHIFFFCYIKCDFDVIPPNRQKNQSSHFEGFLSPSPSLYHLYSGSLKMPSNRLL